MADVAKEVANHLFAYMARVKRDLTKGSNASFDILNLNIPYSCVHIHGLKMAPYGPIWQPMISLDL
ncbi:hypothetical protein CVT25_000677 [Psilocybe cyanescens]|uniref:Uncharacterized protein n=1 Tax=Psilocybe cyanescens TaxID=93625 RepID=A0A409WZN3_PSICY|nr:hypothetical protein CVT25_000677 [Psilocybe cyanescens]